MNLKSGLSLIGDRLVCFISFRTFYIFISNSSSLDLLANQILVQLQVSQGSQASSPTEVGPQDNWGLQQLSKTQTIQATKRPSFLIFISSLNHNVCFSALWFVIPLKKK